MPTPKEQLQQWFQYLQAFQTACETVSAVASSETLLTFAGDTITTDLPTADEQANFLIQAQARTPFTITSSDIASSSTFESLLETVWNPLFIFVTGFIKSCAPPPYSTMTFTDFAQQTLVKVFPGGLGDPNWIAMQNGLSSSIPSSCYTAKQQTAANNLLATATSTVQNLVDLISKLG